MSKPLLYCADLSRGFIRLEGPDRRLFLQGLISNDVEKCQEDRAIWSALLTPQGKFLHDFFLTSHGDSFLIECEKERLMDLGVRLRKFKLRSDIALDVEKSLSVFLIWGADAPWDLEIGRLKAIEDGMWLYADPRLKAMGYRLVAQDVLKAQAWLQEHGAQSRDFEEWNAHRLKLAVPAGSQDCQVEKATLLEYGFDELSGVDWKKGCYMGQELTARTKYRGLVKKRFLPVLSDTPLSKGDILRLDDENGGKEVGTVSSNAGEVSGALIRMDRLLNRGNEGYALMAGDQQVLVYIPEWVQHDMIGKE